MSILDTRPGDGELWQGDTTLPAITVSDLHRLAAVALAEPTCARPGCPCTGVLAELHAKVDAHCAQAVQDSERRAGECRRDGHRFSWLDWTTCLHCGAIA